MRGVVAMVSKGMRMFWYQAREGVWIYFMVGMLGGKCGRLAVGIQNDPAEPTF